MHLLREVAAVGARAARVGVDDQEAVRRQALRQRQEALAVEAVRPAVDVEHAAGSAGPGRSRAACSSQASIVETAALDREALPAVPAARPQQRPRCRR